MRFPLVAALSASLLVAWLPVALVVSPARAEPVDGLLPVLHRMRAFLEREELDGITRDPRYELNPSEVIRLSVVSQLLAYNDLHAVHPENDSLYENVRTRAEFLLAHLGEIRSRSPFDGMLAYALLGAYEITGDPRLFVAGEQIVRDVIKFQGFSNTLNWGLMAAMGIAKYYDLTGYAPAYAKVEEIVSSLYRYQNPDGSFPHYCPASTDVHYTGWMGMELVHIRRYVPSVVLEERLRGIADFLASRVLVGGDTQYQVPCDSGPGCVRYFFSRSSGCWFDYDTRGWINELGYTGLVMDALRRSPYEEVMPFLYSLEEHGAVNDKWAYPPRIDDPIYLWASGERSVIRTSVVFWSLATVYRERRAVKPSRGRRIPPPSTMMAWKGAGASVSDPEPSSGEPWRRFVWTTVDSLVLEGADPEAVCARTPDSTERNARMLSRDLSLAPMRKPLTSGIVGVGTGLGRATIRFAIARDARVSLVIYDLAGRRVRELAAGFRASGEHEADWDGRDLSGATRSAGVYYARLSAEPGGSWSARVLLRR